MPIDAKPQYGRILQRAACNSRLLTKTMQSELKKPFPSEFSINLVDQEPVIFEIYLHWLYFKTLFTIIKAKEKPKTDAEFYFLSKGYILGHKLVDSAFKNAIIDAFVDAEDSSTLRDTPGPGKGLVNIIYEKNPDDSPGSRLLAELWTRYATTDWADVFDEMSSFFFKVKVFQAMTARLGGAYRRDIDPKRFHE